MWHQHQCSRWLLHSSWWGSKIVLLFSNQFFWQLSNVAPTPMFKLIMLIPMAGYFLWPCALVLLVRFWRCSYFQESTTSTGKPMVLEAWQHEIFKHITVLRILWMKKVIDFLHILQIFDNSCNIQTSTCTASLSDTDIVQTLYQSSTHCAAESS